jgi:hydrogenase maturation protease
VRIHVIGVGSGHGDDAVGLAVAAALAAAPLPSGVAVHRCERPLPDLLDALAGAEAAILIDAARTGATPGSVTRLRPGDLAGPRSASSHGQGVAQALALAAHLEGRPEHVEIVAIEIAEPTVPGAPALAPPVQAAIPGAVAMVREILSELGRLAAQPSAGA